MTKKAILLKKASTSCRKNETEFVEFKYYANDMGYSDFIILQESQGLKQAIENNPEIESVFIWKLSQLPRQGSFLYSIRDYLLERKINLIVKEPELILLDENKPIPSSMILFDIFITLVENERITLKARRRKKLK